MQITGRSLSDIDVVVWEDDYLTRNSLEGLLERIQATQADEQFFFREAEFDAAYRQVVIEISNLPHGDSPARELLERIRTEIWAGHDFIGERDAQLAQAPVRRIIEMVHDQADEDPSDGSGDSER